MFSNTGVIESKLNSVDFGIEPFRFIHWNIQAVPKEMAKDV